MKNREMKMQNAEMRNCFAGQKRWSPGDRNGRDSPWGRFDRYDSMQDENLKERKSVIYPLKFAKDILCEV